MEGFRNVYTKFSANLLGLYGGKLGKCASGFNSKMHVKIQIYIPHVRKSYRDARVLAIFMIKIKTDIRFVDLNQTPSAFERFKVEFDLSSPFHVTRRSRALCNSSLLHLVPNNFFISALFMKSS